MICTSSHINKGKLFKTEQLVNQIKGEQAKQTNEKDKLIEAYQAAIKYLQFFNTQNTQQNAFISFMKEFKRIVDDNTNLRSKLEECNKYIASKRSVYIIISIQGSQNFCILLSSREYLN